MTENTAELKKQLIAWVNQIPSGKVMSYGQVGMLVGCSGWIVGRILSGLPQSEWDQVMWQRVVAKDGFIASVKLGFRGQLQIELLEKEGVSMKHNFVDMDRYGITAQELIQVNNLEF